MAAPVGWRELLLNSVGTGGASGFTAGDWWRLLVENRFRIHPCYIPRAAAITLTSLSNSVLGRLERWRFDSRIRQTSVPPPLFILGIWRSGTTHLHYLFGRDPRFAYPNNYQVLNPHTFLTTERMNRRFWSWVMPSKRPQDNVAVRLGDPQEDEFALLAMSRCSPMLNLIFPRRAEAYDRFLTLENASAAEVDRWKRSLLWFAQKLTFKYGRPLVLKSPCHTGRIRLLLELFPDARFVHIYRNPYAVIRSTMRTWQRVVPWWTLQKNEWAGYDDTAIRQYAELLDHFWAEKSLIPPERFSEVCYEHLDRDPLGAMRRIYAELKLPDFSEAEPSMREYLDSVAGYEKNVFRETDAELRAKIAGHCRRFFEAWGYDIDAPADSAPVAVPLNDCRPPAS
jgi:hypothetical protein